jgi:hypothetical protein
MFILPHPHYPWDLAPSDFALFCKFENETEQCFQIVSDNQRESQIVLDNIKENTSTVLSGHGENGGIPINDSTETILKESAAKAA